MESKPCTNCQWCHGSIWNFFRLGAYFGCKHPSTANAVTGLANKDCRTMRNWDHYCGNGHLFERKEVKPQ